MLKYILAGFILVNLGLMSQAVQVLDQEKLDASPVCEVCTLVLSAAKTLLSQNKTADEVLQFIEKDFCGRLGSLSDTCKQYVEQYGPSIIFALVNDIDPTLICNKLGVCQTQQITEPFPVVLPILVTDGLNCTLCKLVFTQVQNALKNNASEQQMIQFIEKTLCNATGSLSAECKALIDTYGPTILTYLAQGIDPTKLCVLIGMCSKNFKISKKLEVLINHSKISIKAQIEREMAKKMRKGNRGNYKILAKNNEVYCTVCQYTMQFLDLELKKNATEQGMLHALEQVCKVAPASTQKECQSLVNTYGIYLIQLLIQLADPLKVCQVIKLC